MQNGLYRIELGPISFNIKVNNYSFIIQQSVWESTTENDARLVHTHKAYELFALVDGEITVITDNGRTIYNDCLVIIPPELRHYVIYRNTSAVILNFSPIEVKGHSGIYKSVTSGIENGITVLPMNDNEGFYCRRLLDEESEPRVIDGRPHLISMLFSEMIMPFINEDNGSAPKHGSHHTAIIESFICKNASGNVLLVELARELHLCPKQTSRIIRKEYGCSLAELVRKQRISVATVMLTKTDMSIHEISASVGYESAKDFRLNFKRICGIPPSEYRKKIQASENN